LIYHILKTARKKVALVSTVEARIGRKSWPTGFHVTSPDPFKLQQFLRQMRSHKIRYVCLEATSHGSDQFRFFPLKPKVAVLTNITHEHLDYHRTFANYLKAKLKILKSANYVILNKDLPNFEEIKSKLGKSAYATYSLESESQLQATQPQFFKDRVKFTLGNLEYELPLPGKYNIYNALAAISVALYLEISPATIRRALRTFKGIPGRMQFLKSKGLTIIIDFAHTPNALQEALTTLRESKPPKSKLIAVFGAAGLRDKSKRPLMGKIAAQLADEVVLTAEDPRTENLASIFADLQQDIPSELKTKIHVIEDRQEAINYALTNLAKKGDWVGIFGKGHEQSMCYGTKEYPWSDLTAVKTALKGVKHA
jgi:UDP-N-acetylmuramoyl-L-alanyl-D-glutamate--2,6-diaminopimelate ligase